MLPELGTPVTRSLNDPGAHARFVEGVVQTLLAATHTQRPAVVLVDDIHWADAASLEVFAYLARRLRARPFLFVVTWRSEETPAAHPARRLVTDAARDGLATTIALDRFDRAQVGELVEAAGLSPGLTEPLFTETRGLPFFVVEYLDSLEEDAVDWPVPSGVRDVLETRLAATGEITPQITAAAAVLGRPFEAEVVRDVSGRSDDETVSALEELIAHGILVELDAAEYDFRRTSRRERWPTKARAAGGVACCIGGPPRRWRARAVAAPEPAWSLSISARRARARGRNVVSARGRTRAQPLRERSRTRDSP